MNNPIHTSGNYRWKIVALLFFATTINYIDRQVIGILKPFIAKDIGWNEADYGFIITAFQIAYAIGLLATGRFLDKFGTRIGYLWAIVLWSIAGMAHAAARGVCGFIACRFFLGLANFPAAVKSVAEWFPKKERAFATGLFNSGSTAGAILPVAEEAGVKLALHPDDPPVDQLRLTARLVNQPAKYQRVIDLNNSPSNCLEFCMGSIQEMSEGDIYESLDTYSKQKKIGYIHFRNVKGKVPFYKEVFVDEGDIDMLRALKILRQNNFDGVLIPDHTPEMSCDAPWHAGMAFALGYMNAALQSLDK